MDAQEIYANHAEQYDALVAVEDVDGQLYAEILRVAPSLSRSRVVEVGAGTGRITRQLVDGGARVRASDRSEAMLAVARRRLADCDPSRWTLTPADARSLPVDDGWADLAIAGWVFGHFRYWEQDRWAAEVTRGLDEMYRVLRPGGRLVIIETMGTAVTQAAPPDEHLAEYYRWLRRRWQMEHRVFRTDYQFASLAEAVRLTGLFFGPELATRVEKQRWVRVPEYTGMWWTTKAT